MLNLNNMKSKQQSQYEKESLSPITSVIVITIILVVAMLGDSIANLF